MALGPYSVRRAIPADADAILRCLHAAFAPYREQYTTDGYQATVLDGETIHHRLSSMRVLVAVTTHGDIVGTLSTCIVDGGTGHLRGMAVIPAVQGRGVARALIAAAEQQLYVEGHRRVTLNTTAPLQRASRFYESVGYCLSGNGGDFFGMPLLEYVKELTPANCFTEATVTQLCRVCVGAIIFDDRCRVFVMRRAATAALAPGAWDIAGGHVNDGESDADALAREIREETGWVVRVVLEQIAEWQWHDRGIARLERDYLVQVDGNLAAPQLDRREHDAWMWVDSTSLEILTEPTTGDARLRDVVQRGIDRLSQIVPQQKKSET